MEQKKNNSDGHIAEIEQWVCDFFALPFEEVFSKTTKRDKVLARHFTIYVLHKHFNVSLSVLARRYNCTTRNISHICTNISNYIIFDKRYKNHYHYLMQYIKERG